MKKLCARSLVVVSVLLAWGCDGSNKAHDGPLPAEGDSSGSSAHHAEQNGRSDSSRVTEEQLPAESEHFDLSKCRVKQTEDEDANLILWVDSKIEGVTSDEYIFLFKVTPLEEADDDLLSLGSGWTMMANFDGPGGGGGVSAGIKEITQKGVLFHLSSYWHIDEDDGRLDEVVLLPFKEPQKITRGRLSVSSSFEWKKNLLEQAANGEPSAQYRLGELYWYGKGLEKDNEQAAAWYRRAAKQGDGQAQRMLAHFYSRGYGVPKDLAEAYKWRFLCNRAAGFSEEESRKTIARGMTPEDIAEGERRVAEFLQQAEEERK